MTTTDRTTHEAEAGTPEQVVRTFCRLMGEKDFDAIAPLFTEDAIYHNVGTEPAVGREATLSALRFQLGAFDPINWRIIRLAVDGDTVLTERVDEITARGITAPIPVMGSFVVQDGKIAVWRDYFDMALAQRLMAGEDASAVVPGL